MLADHGRYRLLRDVKASVLVDVVQLLEDGKGVLRRIPSMVRLQPLDDCECLRIHPSGDVYGAGLSLEIRDQPVPLVPFPEELIGDVERSEDRDLGGGA